MIWSKNRMVNQKILKFARQLQKELLYLKKKMVQFQSNNDAAGDSIASRWLVVRLLILLKSEKLG